MNEIVIGNAFRVDLDPDRKPNLGLDRPYDGNYFIQDGNDSKFYFRTFTRNSCSALTNQRLQPRTPHNILFKESANASNAVKRRLQEVLLARQLRPSNESVSNVAIPCTNQGAISWQSGCAEFPLRKTGTTKRHHSWSQSHPNFKYSKHFSVLTLQPIKTYKDHL